MGDFDLRSDQTTVATQSARSLAVTRQGHLYVAVGHGSGLARLNIATQTVAHNQQRAPSFGQNVLPFDVDETAVATDGQGNVWVAVAGQPDLARYTPTTGKVQKYQYAAPSVAAHPVQDLPHGAEPTTPAPGAVWITHIVAMVCDAQGNLWYIRAGSDQLEEVTPWSSSSTG